MAERQENAQEARAFARAERILDSLVQNPKIELSAPGKEWLVSALDPFHDRVLKNLNGWPDVETGRSTVRCVTQDFSFNATTGGGAVPAGPWNAHIVLWPWQNLLPLFPSTLRANNVFSTPVPQAGVPTGGLQVYRVDNGTLDIMSAIVGYRLGGLQLDPAFSQGASRIIGIGFEVRDTSAVINRQGSLTSWKYSTLPRDPVCMANVSTSGVFYGPISVVEYRYPPTTNAAAKLIPGSVTRKSEEGSYMVGTFHSNENPPFGPCPVVPGIMPPAFDESTTASSAQLITPTPTPTILQIQTAPPITLLAHPMSQLFPYHMCGVQLSGLNPNSTFTVTMKIYMERFPSLAELNELTIATPSCEFDPMALNIYSHAMSRMPTDVPVAMNPMGEWFQDLMETVSSWLKPLPGPLGAAGALGESVAKATRPLLINSPPAQVVKVVEVPQQQKKKRNRRRNRNKNTQKPAPTSKK